FTIPGGPSAAIHGSFTTSSTEFWEDGAYLPVRSTGSSSYAADVTYVVTFHLDVQVKVNATTTLGSVPPFGLDVGENASAPHTTGLSVFDIALFVVLPIVLAAVVVFLIWRRRKARKPEPPSPATGGGPPAR